MISVFELFSIGIGPSSSHTVGPMRAAREFITHLSEPDKIRRIAVTLHGSLAFTGKGHATDKAIAMGLLGHSPETIDPDIIHSTLLSLQESKTILLARGTSVHFDPQSDIHFDYQTLFDYHSNAMQFMAYGEGSHLLEKSVYFSVGGGFIVHESQIHHASTAAVPVPYPFYSAAELMKHCQRHGLSIAQIVLENENALSPHVDIPKQIKKIADVMEDCINKGCQETGTLPGNLHLRRRAPALYQKLIAEDKPHPRHPQTMNWLNVYAMAVNEENAAGGRVVTAPTNGAAGIIPAVLNYYKYFCEGANEQGVLDYLLTASAIGTLYKMNASISGAEMGCQGEVGVACSMAAAALTAALGGTVEQVENAAEIGMEHNLGLTCDPVGGLVQIPCIERNAMGAVKAINAAQLALAEDGQHRVSLDMVIDTMREIGKNMHSMYKETSKGGLAVAVNVTEC